MEFFFILLLLAGFAYWLDITRINELALQYCRHLCRQNGVQLLDSSVSMQRQWLRRSSNGLQFCRLYTFEFSGDGDSRRHGYIVVLGRQVAEQHMEPWPVPQSPLQS